MNAEARRSHAPRQRRPTSLVLLLLCTLALAAMLAYEARAAAQSQRDTVERELHDDAGFAATEFVGGVVEDLASGLGATLSTVTSGRAMSAYENLPGPTVLGPLGTTALRCADPAEDSLRFYFRLDLRDGVLTTSGARPSAADAQWVRDHIAGPARIPYQASWPFAVFLGGPADEGATFVYSLKYSVDEAPIAAFGFRTCRSVLGTALFRRVIEQRPLLPRSWTGGVSTDSVLIVSVTDRSGRTMFETRHAGGSPYVASAKMDQLGLGAANATIRPTAIETLMMDATPQSRIPLLVGLLLLMGGMIAVTLMQLRRETELARLQADFVSSVSHELRTPLSQILLFAETLELGRTRSDDERRTAASIIVEEGRRLMHLVENVLLFTRTDRQMTRLAPESLPLDASLRQIVNDWLPLGRGASIALAPTVSPDVAVRVDPSTLRQMLLNILDNAAKYGPSAQTIRIDTAVSERTVRISVDDEGPGIPPRDRERVWDAFFRLDAHATSSIAGCGIGLYVVRELARLQGGDTWVEDGPLGGARFVIQLERA